MGCRATAVTMDVERMGCAARTHLSQLRFLSVAHEEGPESPLPRAEPSWAPKKSAM